MMNNNSLDNSSESCKAQTQPVKKIEWVIIALLLGLLPLIQAQMDVNSLYINVGTDPYYQLIMAKLHANPSLYQNDPVFHESAYATRAYIAYPMYLTLLHRATQLFSFFGALGLLQVLLSYIYLGGATFFLYKLSQRPWVSALIACLSARQILIFPSEQWGVLSAAMVVPGTFFLAFSPLLFWGWLQFQDKPVKKRLLFLFQGFLGTLHPLSWYTITLSMLFAQLVNGRFKRATLIDTALCGSLAFLPMLPFVLAWRNNKTLTHLPEGAYQTALKAFYGIFPSLRIETITVGLVQGLLMDFGWIVLTLLALLKIRHRVPKLALYFASGCILLFLASYALNEWVLIPQKMPLFLDGNRTLKFLLLPAMLIITLWLAQFRGSGLQWRSATVFLLVVVLNAPLLWKDIQQQPTAIAQHVFDQWQSFNDVRHPSYYLQRGNLYDTSAWLKQHINSTNSLIFVSYPDRDAAFIIRALGEKSVVYAWSDGGFLYQADPERFMKWIERGRLLDQLHKTEDYCGVTEVHYAKTLKATHLLCPTWRIPIGLKLLYRNEMTAILAL